MQPFPVTFRGFVTDVCWLLVTALTGLVCAAASSPAHQGWEASLGLQYPLSAGGGAAKSHAPAVRTLNQTSFESQLALWQSAHQLPTNRGFDASRAQREVAAAAAAAAEGRGGQREVAGHVSLQASPHARHTQPQDVVSADPFESASFESPSANYGLGRELHLTRWTRVRYDNFTSTSCSRAPLVLRLVRGSLSQYCHTLVWRV